MTREEAIKYLGWLRNGTNIVEYRKAILMAIAALREQKERRWVPVSERLPDVGIEVLIYSEDDGVCVDYYGGDSFGYYNVTHWMPLPQPPKGE